MMYCKIIKNVYNLIIIINFNRHAELDSASITWDPESSSGWQDFLMSQLECKNLTLGYGTKTVIENLSFSVNKGDYLCIVGENGSGKTTLMKTILRLLKPLSGTIETGDGLLPDEISYLPQQTDVQRDFPASVREIVLSGCQSRCGKRPFYNKAEKQLALAAMEKLGITHLAKKCYRELSGGQQQRTPPAPCVPPRKCCFWMNLLQAWTLPQHKRCTSLLKSLIKMELQSLWFPMIQMLP